MELNRYSIINVISQRWLQEITKERFFFQFQYNMILSYNMLDPFCEINQNLIYFTWSEWFLCLLTSYNMCILIVVSSLGVVCISKNNVRVSVHHTRLKFSTIDQCLIWFWMIHFVCFYYSGSIIHNTMDFCFVFWNVWVNGNFSIGLIEYFNFGRLYCYCDH